MTRENTHALSDVLDQLEDGLTDEQVCVRDIVVASGRSSFASLILIFALVCTSPASTIPGLTTATALIVFSLTIQLILGREAVWLPNFIMCRSVSSKTIMDGIAWLRKPVRFVERFLKVRFTIVFERPWLWIPLTLILCVTLFMPFMEVIPASGSIASAVIAMFGAGLLARDGVLVAISLVALSIVPVVIWQIGFV
ncbi:exopolysaccharide biosynthesis protein [Celeribacter halophilus]|uniref:exopolysaccharide biosynthesis protein n=1 Tax=Celeribacter halophilus TaxID=576117 RepID=UPI003A91A00D